MLEPSLCLGKASGNQDYMVSIEVWTKTAVARKALSDAVKALLHVYSTLPIQLSRLDSETVEELESAEEGDIYHAIQTYLMKTTIV
jgi:hypothetical protein